MELFMLFWLNLGAQGENLASLLSWIAYWLLVTRVSPFCLQSWSEYFGIFWCFTKLSFQHEWSESWLLVINIVYTTCLMSCCFLPLWGFSFHFARGTLLFMTKQINCQLSWITKAHRIFDIIQKDHYFPPTKSRTN